MESDESIRVPVEPCEEDMPIDYDHPVEINFHPALWGEDEYHVSGTLYSLTRLKRLARKPGRERNSMEIMPDGLKDITTKPLPKRQAVQRHARGL